MPNMTPAKFTKQLGPMVTPETAARLEAYAVTRGVSVSTLTREMIERDLKRQCNKWNAELEERLGSYVAAEEAFGQAYEAALARTAAQGEKHVSRRRKADSARRGAGGTDSGES